MLNPKSIKWLLFALICLAAARGSAQTSAPTQLALEVHFYPQEPPAYQTVHPSAKRPSWYARFSRVAGWTTPVESLPVTAVNINSQPAEAGVRVWVSVYLGKLHEQEQQVAAYVLREGESVTVNELENFGVVPFEIKLVRLTATSGQTPQFRSKAPSIELVSIRPNFSTTPSVELVVRNLSPKAVHALELLTFQDGRPRSSTMPQGKEGNALIPPGETLELTARLSSPAVRGPDGYAPQVLPDQTIAITTAVFADGTYEGDIDNAMAFLGFQKGRKTQLARVGKLFADAQEGTNDLSWLKAQVEKLNLDADPSDVAELSRQFPPGTLIEETFKPGPRPLVTDDLKMVIQLGMKIKDNVLKDITQFELQGRRAEPGVFKSWLEASKARYQAWFSRL